MLSYPAAIPLSSRTLRHLAERIRRHCRQRRSRWRRLDPARQALLAPAHLRNGDTCTRLAAGFRVGVAIAWRYVREAIALLAAAADDLATAVARIRAHSPSRSSTAPSSPSTVSPTNGRTTPASIDGHGVNVQVITDAAGRLLWSSAALPGAVHDLTAARTHGILDALTNAGVMTFADKGYQGAGGTVRTPFKRHRHRPRLSRRQRSVNKAHAKVRACGERAIAALKTWKLLTKLRCCPR